MAFQLPDAPARLWNELDDMRLKVWRDHEYIGAIDHTKSIKVRLGLPQGSRSSMVPRERTDDSSVNARESLSYDPKDQLTLHAPMKKVQWTSMFHVRDTTQGPSTPITTSLHLEHQDNRGHLWHTLCCIILIKFYLQFLNPYPPRKPNPSTIRIID
ncbi:hypothetical protein Fot_39709 [Forsythia ovata]|uniref:Uncharacterized protein n=1 Tax=Forsythia ovata TaxID=205694 RepID=A0ABD1S857_9LAMI